MTSQMHDPILRLKATELKPDAKQLMRQFVTNHDSSTVEFGFIHGSMIYSAHGALCKAYKEIRIHDPHDDSVVGIEFKVKNQQPDIDIVVVVKDRQAFKTYFEALSERTGLASMLNYFLTINVMEVETFTAELQDARPRALRRILLYRPTWVFGDKTAFDNAKSSAEHHRTTGDAQFQREFEDRKLFLKSHLLSGAKDFTIATDDYQELFPLFFKHLSDDAGGFPELRDKYVLPHGMDLKAKRYTGLAQEEQLR